MPAKGRPKKPVGGGRRLTGGTKTSPTKVTKKPPVVDEEEGDDDLEDDDEVDDKYCRGQDCTEIAQIKCSECDITPLCEECSYVPSLPPACLPACLPACMSPCFLCVRVYACVFVRVSTHPNILHDTINQTPPVISTIASI
jgi:hypothetical protein